jgi:predicted Fe-S protein YdhL (DUF1289 family)
MDGSEGPRAQSTRAFARNLAKLPEFEGIAITFWDERLSTVAAEKALLEADTTRKRRAEVIDAVAAGYILQGALDRLGISGREMSDDIWKRDEVESPCVKICVVHPEARICTGCLRSIDEITTWGRMTREERRAVMAELPERQALLKVRRGGRAARMARKAT